ncbi:serine/threonine-protein kinase [Edaphobacter sp.]|uniref:serine/threonine-protein kinase n=1 Tax=Edaphobacter sp. TaxID=1934404 RepID=UPI002DBBFC45|nr:protein kinase [Edaphobacter sp.]HEU5340118.1 protein kinase [Edaphobacter sp.]
MAFEIGQRVGDYEILELLGRGGMGHVYRARNIISDRIEAMKVLLPDLSAERDLAVRFISEIRTLAAFDHPNIALLHTAFQSDNQLIMVMEYVEGYTLEQRAKQGPLSVADVTGYVSQALSALSYAHARGVIHRDIKPANLMLTPHGVVKLMDFGIAKSNVDINLTRPGTTVGSFYYMSPEQVRGSNVDARSDLYSVGIVLYELLAGRRPFEGDSTYGVLNQQLNDAPRPPIEINPSLPPQLNAIILTALAKDPAGRFQNADAFRNALKAFRTESPVEANAAAAAVAAPVAAQAESSYQSVSAQQQPFASVEPQQPLPKSSHSSKPLWIATGALGAVIAIVAVAITVPRMLKTHASEAANSAASANQPAASSGPSATPKQNAATPPATSPTDSGAQANQPSTPPAATSQTTLPAASASSTNTPPPATSSAVVAGASHAPSDIRAIHKAVASMKSGLASAAPQNEAVTQAVAQPQAGPPQEEMDQLQERMTRLSARASTVDESLSQIRSQQAAQGLGLRNDMATADNLMRSYLRAANRDMQSSRLASAGSNMDKAEAQLEVLEKFLGK